MSYSEYDNEYDYVIFDVIFAKRTKSDHKGVYLFLFLYLFVFVANRLSDSRTCPSLVPVVSVPVSTRYENFALSFTMILTLFSFA